MHCTDCVGTGKVLIETSTDYRHRVDCEECSGTGFAACPRCSSHNERREGAGSCVECAKYVASEARKLLRTLEEEFDDCDAKSEEAQRAFRELLGVIIRIEKRYDLGPTLRAA